MSKPVECKKTNEILRAKHGIIASDPYDFYGYYGWPSVARTPDGMLIVVASGLRNAHVCPFGRTIMCTSSDNGNTWSSPAVVNDFPADDRDAGVVSLGGDSLMISWFSSDTNLSTAMDDIDSWDDAEKVARYRDGLRRIKSRRTGFWLRTSHDRGETWEPPVRFHLTAPHGPVLLSDGKLIFFGKGNHLALPDTQSRNLGILAMESGDLGGTWKALGLVPLADGTVANNYHEPHVVEISPGHLLGLIRVQNWEEEGIIEKLGKKPFSMAQTVSKDGGKTWTQAELLGFHGSPPHVIKHSSGRLVCTYGYRKEPCGQRVMISDDGGESWTYNYILRNDGPDTDLGYPASAELDNGDIFTVYYQKVESIDEKCSLLWSRWQLPTG